jgi:hypothetical protein
VKKCLDMLACGHFLLFFLLFDVLKTGDVMSFFLDALA